MTEEEPKYDPRAKDWCVNTNCGSKLDKRFYADRGNFCYKCHVGIVTHKKPAFKRV